MLGHHIIRTILCMQIICLCYDFKAGFPQITQCCRKQRSIIGFKPQFSIRLQQWAVKFQKPWMGQPTLMMTRFWPRITEIDIQTRNAVRCAHNIRQALNIIGSESDIVNRCFPICLLNQPLTRSQHCVLQVNAKVVDFRMLGGKPCQKPAFSAAEFYMQGLPAREPAQPFVFHSLWISQKERTGIQFRTCPRFCSYSHQLSLSLFA